MEKILITGASGFIGSFFVEYALKEGYKVWAAIRKTSSKRYLQNNNIHFFELDILNDALLKRQLEDHSRQHGAFDYVIHAAGVTKCKKKQDFYTINTEGTEKLARLLCQTKCLKKRFVFISSLSIFGPIHETDNLPIKDSDVPKPNTDYGKSKFLAEQKLASIENLDYIILRPTGVYGPREKDYFMMVKSIMQRIDFSAGYQPQTITFIYVKDLAQATFSALRKGRSRCAYTLSDGKNYSSRSFSEYIQKELKIKQVAHIKTPLFFLKSICYISEKLSQLTGSLSTLNMDKYKILKQRNWQCDIQTAINELDYIPAYPLERGTQETVEWYIQNGWI